MTAAEEAAQLDSVTDVVQERELDASVAQAAMSSLAAAKEMNKESTSKISVSSKDVDLIVSEMEVTEDEATRALREAVDDLGEGQSESLVEAALRKLVVS